MNAAATIVSLPVIVLYFIFQRHFIRGMVSGAIKDRGGAPRRVAVVLQDGPVKGPPSVGVCASRCRAGHPAG